MKFNHIKVYILINSITVILSNFRKLVLYQIQSFYSEVP